MRKSIKHWLRLSFVSGLSAFLVINPVNASTLWAAALQHGGCGFHHGHGGSPCQPICHPPILRCGPVCDSPPIHHCPPPCWMTIHCPPPSSCCSPAWTMPVAPQCDCGGHAPLHVYRAPLASPMMPHPNSMNRGMMNPGTMNPGMMNPNSSKPTTGWNPPPPGASSNSGNMLAPMPPQQRLKPQQLAKPYGNPEENAKPSLKNPAKPQPQVAPPTPNPTVPSNPFPSEVEKPKPQTLDLDALMPANDPPSDTVQGNVPGNSIPEQIPGQSDAGNADADIIPNLNLDSDSTPTNPPAPNDDDFPANDMPLSNDASLDNSNPPETNPTPTSDGDFDLDNSPSESMPAETPSADQDDSNDSGFGNMEEPSTEATSSDADKDFEFGSDTPPANVEEKSAQPGTSNDTDPNPPSKDADPKEEFDWDLDATAPPKADSTQPSNAGDDTFPTSQEQPRADDKKDNDANNWLDDLGMMRQWIDNTGSFSTQARLVTIFPDKVRLLKDNGHYATVPFRRLSDDDKKFVRQVAMQLTHQPQGQYVNTKASNDVK